jgi:hypothetical protein
MRGFLGAIFNGRSDSKPKAVAAPSSADAGRIFLDPKIFSY